MIPWFRKYPYTDFHELNIDFLCESYKKFYEQLQEFDTRLTGIVESVDQRITAMEADISAFETSITSDINAFKAEVNTRFATLSASINQQFSDLQDALEGRIDDLEDDVDARFAAQADAIQAQFDTLEAAVSSQLTSFETRLYAAESKIRELETGEVDNVANKISTGLFNYYPAHNSFTYVDDSQPNCTANEDLGVISVSGTVSEDVITVLAGSPNSFPVSLSNIAEDMRYTIRFLIYDGNYPALDTGLILYVNGSESRRVITHTGAMIDITRAEFDTLSGIEIVAIVKTGTAYNIRYLPYIVGYALNDTNMSGYTFTTLVQAFTQSQRRIHIDELVLEEAESSNLITKFTLDPFTIYSSSQLDITMARDGIINISGTVSTDRSYIVFDNLEIETDGYATLMVKDILDDTADNYTPKMELFGDQIYYFTENEYPSIISGTYTLKMQLQAGTYSMSIYPYISKNMSNLQLTENMEDLNDRVQEVENQLIGETTYEGDMIDFTDPVGEIPLKEVICELKPDRNTHGYGRAWQGGTGKNKINASNAGSVAAGGTIYSGSIDLDADTTYTLSSSDTSATIAVVGIGTGVMPYTFTTSADMSSITITAVTEGTFNNIMIEDGSSATSYEPYANISPIISYDEINVTKAGKNLFNGTNVINAYLNNNGIITSSALTRTVYARCKANTTYTISKMAGARFAVAYTSELPVVGLQCSGYMTNYVASSITMTTNSNAKYICAFVYISTSDIVTAQEMLDSVQIEEGNAATTYEPYIGQTYTISLGTFYYGGSVNLEAGEISDDWDYIASYNGEALPGIWLSDRDEYVPGYNPTIGAEVIYKTAAPALDPITPVDIITFEGLNTMWCDTGNIKVTTKAFVEALINKFTEPFIVTYNSSTQEVDKTIAQMVEAYNEGRRVVFKNGSIEYELNCYDSLNQVFEFEYMNITAGTSIEFGEITIDGSGVTINTETITISTP